MNEEEEEDAIPAFCRIDATTRDAAWVRNPPRPMPKFNEARREEEPATKALRAQMEQHEQRKKAEGLESLRAWKEEQATQRAAEGFTPKAPKLFHKRKARVPKKPQRKRRVQPK